MPDIVDVTWEEVYDRAYKMADRITRQVVPENKQVWRLFPVPRGGVYAAMAIQVATGHHTRLTIVDDVRGADVYVDDIIDSGKTKEACLHGHHLPFFALYDKLDGGDEGWIRFPWERLCKEDGPEENVRRIIEYIGDDPNRPGVLETPSRVVRSYAELFSGYKVDPASIFKTFDEPCDEMVIVRDIEFYSTCEHHMLPFFGKAHIGYIPNGKVAGVSKLARLLDVYARRLQIQERIGQQITNDLDKYLQARGSACVLEAKHSCMTCRGVNKQHSTMVTSSLTGVFREKPEVRAEFLSMIKE